MKITQKIRFSLIAKFLKNEITEERTYLVLTILAGIGGALVAVGLEHSVEFVRHILKTDRAFTKESFILGGIAVFISGWITTRKFPWTAGSSVPNVRIALAVFHGKIELKNTIAKFFTTVLSLGAGISLGPEGPIVAISSGIGSYIGNFFSMSKKRVKALVAVGSAGGIAAAFNTPITAVVFTLEEVVGDLNAKILGSIVIAAVVASVTAQLITGSAPLFSQLHYKLNNPKELIFYLAIGVVAAIAGPLWMKTVIKLRHFNKTTMRNHKLSFMMIGFVLVGALSHINPAVLGSGHGTIENTLLSLISDPKVLGTLFLLKFISSAVCYSSGISGGLFLPALLMGASLGGFFGSVASEVFQDSNITMGAYALVGMGAFFAAVIRAPFTSIIMVFELTRDYNIILPLMIASITAYVISSRIEKESIYELIAEQDGIHLPTREDHEVLEQLVVEDAMRTDLITFEATLQIKEVFKMNIDNSISGFPILRNGRLVGMVSRSDIQTELAKGNGELTIDKICERKIIKIYQDQSLLVAFHRLQRFQISRLPVVSRLDDKHIIGIITAQDIVKNFGYQIQEEEKKAHFEDKDVFVETEPKEKS